MYSLGEAAKTAGRAKSTILRDIRRGKLSAARTEAGGYQIEPAELARVYPPQRSMQRSPNGASNDAQPGAATVEVDRLLDQLSDLRETIRDLRVRLDASEAERRYESEEHHRAQERLTALLTHRQAGSVPAAGSPSFTGPKGPWWRRWFG
jgi:chromosome segregation ATPase